MRYLLPLLALALPAAAAAQSLSGPARVVDGDSLSIAGIQVRLHGIDAPEGRQTCERAGRPWPCGQVAADKLGELVAGKAVHCSRQGTDAYGRMLAICSAGGAELNRTMVESGWALAFRKYSSSYVAEETRARQAKLGIWDSSFVPPEQFRSASRTAPQTQRAAAPAAVRPRGKARAEAGGQDCAIKGNHSRRGDWIYHLPGMPYYDRTVPEAMFCTEAQARAAGYRKSRAEW